jgi:hypothetical protein
LSSVTPGKAIESIEVGDLVWARCEFTGEEGFKPVVHLFRNSADRLVHLSYRRDPGSARRGSSGSKGGDAEDGDDPATITGTDEHPFWSLTRNAWVEMAALKPGERLLLADGEATVTDIRIEHLDRPVTVYNFEVADWHTYHVGTQEAGWVFVHNLCARGSVARLKQIRAENRALGLVQDHHLIPHAGRANFQRHGLVQAANVNLRTYGRNIRALGNHRGGHSGAYRQGVRDILDAQLDLFKQGGGKNAQRYLDDAISQIEQGIRNRSLRPYTNKDVWFPR